MGDSFTLAGFLLAVGTLVCGSALAIDSPRCECWGSRRGEWTGIEESEAEESSIPMTVLPTGTVEVTNGDEGSLSPA